MDEIRPSPSPSPPTATGNTTAAASTPESKSETSAMSRMKKECLSLAVSLQEGFRYVKATFVAQAKKLTARNEKEATAADLQASKMQVEAADEAENAKNKLDKSL